MRSVRVVELNGDHDGFADTGETLDLWVTVSNKTGGALTHVVAQLSTQDPRIDCVSVSDSVVALLPAGESVELPAPFRLTVSALADRAGVVPPVACTAGACSNGAGPCASPAACARTALDDYAAALLLTFTADQLSASRAQSPVMLDLDLDITSRTAATTTFADGFEAGFTAWFLDALDANKATNTLSDGYRCKYNDPDLPGSNSYGDTECYLGFAAGQDPANDWHVHAPSSPDGGRAFAGMYSAHFGIHSGTNPIVDTYGLSQMDAIRTKNAIRLAARICRDDPSANPSACGVDADCAGFGGPCVAAAPVLSFKHQIRLEREERVPAGDGEQTDRAVVHAQVSGTTRWVKIYPFQNVYDLPGTDDFSNCAFDPVDDGNDEDSFDWSLPGFGPSSTCKPEYVFTRIGSTGAYSPSEIGRASDGPGLSGAIGPGTWVESRFDLSRFRGKSIRIRFLVTSIKVYDTPTYESLFHYNPEEADDGWYIDDVRVTQVLGTAATTVSADTAGPPAPVLCDSDADGVVNSLDDCPYDFDPAQTDGDGDGVADACDPCPALAESQQIDSDGDGIGNACDAQPACRGDVDADEDGSCDSSDDCAAFFDPAQEDRDEDGVGDLCDDCPSVADTTQTDSDGDGQGDACDPCPLGIDGDGDGDGIACPGDNCPSVANVSQGDTDGDGIGDACDSCPAAAGADPDGDGICGAADSCPTRSNPEQTATYLLDEHISTFVLSADGSRVVYPTKVGTMGVASVSTSGGPSAVVFSAPRPSIDALDFHGTNAIVSTYNSTSDTNHRNAVPTGARPGIVLHLGTGFGASGFTPDGTRAIYANDHDYWSLRVADGASVRLAGPIGSTLMAFTPDSSRVLLWIDDGGRTLVSVPVAGGAATILHGPFPAGAVPLVMQISPDGRRVAYIVTDEDDATLYSTPVPGGTPIALDTGLSNGGYLMFSPDSAWIVYSLPGSTLRSVPSSGGPSAALFGTTPTPSITPDSRYVFVSEGGQYAIPIEGGPVRTISTDPGPGALSPDGANVVYRTALPSFGLLYSVPFSGGASVLLGGSSPQPADRFVITPDGTRVVWSKATVLGEFYQNNVGLYVVPIRGGPVKTLFNGTVGLYSITPDSARVLARFNVSSSGMGLRAAELDPDPDGDGVMAPCDVCPGIADPLQLDHDADGAGDACDCDGADPSIHPGAPERNDGHDNQCPGDPGYGSIDEVEGVSGFFDAADRDEYSWNPQIGATSYQIARAASADFATALACTTTAERSWTDPARPAVGAAYFYLVRPLAPYVGSWGRRSTGAERSVPCP